MSKKLGVVVSLCESGFRICVATGLTATQFTGFKWCENAFGLF